MSSELILNPYKSMLFPVVAPNGRPTSMSQIHNKKRTSTGHTPSVGEPNFGDPIKQDEGRL